MLDWKNRAGSAPERAAEPKSDTRSYLGGLLFSRALPQVNYWSVAWVVLDKTNL